MLFSCTLSPLIAFQVCEFALYPKWGLQQHSEQVLYFGMMPKHVIWMVWRPFGYGFSFPRDFPKKRPGHKAKKNTVYSDLS